MVALDQQRSNLSAHLGRLLALAMLGSAAILGLVSLRYAEQPDRRVTDYCNLVVAQATTNLRAFLRAYEDATFQFVANQDLNQLLTDCVASPDPYEIAPYSHTFSNFLEGYTFGYRGVFDAVFLDECNENRKALTMRESLPASFIKSLRNSEAYKSAIKADGKPTWTFEPDCAHTGIDCVMVGRRIKGLFTESPLGVLIILIQADELARVVNDYLHDHFYFSVGTAKTNYTVVADGDGRIISAPLWENGSADPLEGISYVQELYSGAVINRADGSFTTKINGEDVVAILRSIEGTDWRVFVPVSLAGLFDKEADGGFSRAFPVSLTGGLIAGALATAAIFMLLWPRRRLQVPPVVNASIARTQAETPGSTEKEGSPSQEDLPRSRSRPEWKQQLSRKEMQVLILLSQGHSNKEIARTLCVAEQTVKNYVSSIYSKLDVHDRVQASLLAVSEGLHRLDWHDFE
ncbi:MAG: LuxR C-terminal-related transcriptional regulator [Firmicutes bacterium]|jgi:DNA-binding CsgD family transcriptional regulator|nr:LuxR C-terminal-related transcriptional regulator [Bacillota bacterium]